MKELLTAPGMTPRILFAAYARLASGEPFAAGTSVVAPPAPSKPDLAELFAAERTRVGEELTEKESARLPVDAAALTEGVAAALHHVADLEITTRAERERFLSFVRAPGSTESELVILYLTAMHHLSVAAGLARAAELARTTKVVVVRERRFDIPASW